MLLGTETKSLSVYLIRDTGTMCFLQTIKYRWNLSISFPWTDKNRPIYHHGNKQAHCAVREQTIKVAGNPDHMTQSLCIHIIEPIKAWWISVCTSDLLFCSFFSGFLGGRAESLFCGKTTCLISKRDKMKIQTFRVAKCCQNYNP